jgi:hypothetical protein
MLSPWEKRMRVHANNREVSVHPRLEAPAQALERAWRLGPDRTTAVIMKQRRGLGALVGAGPASGLLSNTDRVTMSFFEMLWFFIESKRAGSWRPIAIGSGVWISRWRGDADWEQMPKRDRVISTW